MTSSIVCPEAELVGRIRQGIVARCGHSGPEADGLLDRAHLEELKQIQREAGEPIVAGMITRIGGFWLSIVRTCTGEVCVRRRSREPSGFGLKKKVSCMSRAGWFSGKLSLVKL